MNITNTSHTFILLVSYHWILYLDIAPSTQFHPHNTLSILCTPQLMRDIIFLLGGPLSGSSVLPLYNCNGYMWHFSGLSSSGFTGWGDFSRSLAALQDTAAYAMVKDSVGGLGTTTSQV